MRRPGAVGRKTPDDHLSKSRRHTSGFLGTALITTISGLPTTEYADTALSTIDQYVLPEQIELSANLAYVL
jgi:hypothetical protein